MDQIESSYEIMVDVTISYIRLLSLNEWDRHNGRRRQHKMWGDVKPQCDE
jgi:hypothetical protein